MGQHLVESDGRGKKKEWANSKKTATRQDKIAFFVLCKNTTKQANKQNIDKHTNDCKKQGVRDVGVSCIWCQRRVTILVFCLFLCLHCVI
jgi:hypothetical protein